MRSSEGYVLAEALAARVLGEDATVTDRFTGADMVGAAYEPPFGFIPAERLRRQGPHRPARGLRLRRGRHRHRPHRDRLRRGRLPARRRVRPQRRQPGQGRRHLRRAHRPVRERLRQARRQRPDQGPRGARADVPLRAPAAQLPALLALRHAAALLRQGDLVHPHVGGQGPAAGGQRERQLAPRPHQARPLRPLAGEQRRLGARARALLGHAAADLAQRGGRDRRRRLLRGASRSTPACCSTTRTARSSTTS